MSGEEHRIVSGGRMRNSAYWWICTCGAKSAHNPGGFAAHQGHISRVDAERAVADVIGQRLVEVMAERDALKKQVTTTLALHRRLSGTECAECALEWPCSTVRTLSGSAS